MLKRLDLYYKPHLSNVKMDRLRPAMIQLRQALLAKGLHPKTVSDILGTPRAVAAYAFDAGLSFHPAPGPTAPLDRTPKRRYPSFAELRGLIDVAAASDHRHILPDIYRRRKLAYAYEVAKVLERDWWPEIQKHCKFDLKLPEAPKARKSTKQGKSAA